MLQATRSALEHVEAFYDRHLHLFPPMLVSLSVCIRLSDTLYNPATITRNSIHNHDFPRFTPGDLLARWYRRSRRSLFTSSRLTQAG